MRDEHYLKAQAELWDVAPTSGVTFDTRTWTRRPSLKAERWHKFHLSLSSSVFSYAAEATSPSFEYWSPLCHHGNGRSFKASVSSPISQKLKQKSKIFWPIYIELTCITLNNISNVGRDKGLLLKSTLSLIMTPATSSDWGKIMEKTL